MILTEPQAFFFVFNQLQINALTLWLHSRDYTPAATSSGLMIFMSVPDICSVDRTQNFQFAKQMLWLLSAGVYIESVWVMALSVWKCVW